uniref:Uncharacterized protein n=1 Tax=Arundo donax TaxID=35708 RepID=A0A0A9F775_ARUDO
MGKIIQHSFGIQVYPYDRIPAYVGTLLSMCRNQHCTSHSKTKDLLHVEIKLKSETFTKCLYPLL